MHYSFGVARQVWWGEEEGSRRVRQKDVIGAHSNSHHFVKARHRAYRKEVGPIYNISDPKSGVGGRDLLLEQSHPLSFMRREVTGKYRASPYN